MTGATCPTCDTQHHVEDVSPAAVDAVAVPPGPFQDRSALERFAAAMDDTMRARDERDR